MRTTGRIGMSLLVALFVSISTPASAFTIEEYLSAAALKVQQGDLEAAAVLYQKALKLDRNNFKARKGLAEVLMQARFNDPDAEHSGAELAVIQEASPSS